MRERKKKNSRFCVPQKEMEALSSQTQWWVHSCGNVRAHTYPRKVHVSQEGEEKQNESMFVYFKISNIFTL